MSISVDYISHMGNDNSIVDAARVSFAKHSSNYTKEQNDKLIKYLAKHDHFTPFCHTAITLRVKAPIPIRTQCFKHKVGLVENEESRRYISTEPELYIPESFRTRPDGSIKQGSGEEHEYSDFYTRMYVETCEKAIDTYMNMLNGGIAPEQARLVLPQGVMVNWVWTGNLYAFANFVKKRSDVNAQYEVSLVADEVAKIIQPLYPVAWDALMEK